MIQGHFQMHFYPPSGQEFQEHEKKKKYEILW